MENIKITPEELSEIINKTLERFGNHQCNLSEGARMAIIQAVLKEIEDRQPAPKSDLTLMDSLGANNGR